MTEESTVLNDLNKKHSVNFEAHPLKYEQFYHENIDLNYDDSDDYSSAEDFK
jgi:hypothetical protein